MQRLVDYLQQFHESSYYRKEVSDFETLLQYFFNKLLVDYSTECPTLTLYFALTKLGLSLSEFDCLDSYKYLLKEGELLIDTSGIVSGLMDQQTDYSDSSFLWNKAFEEVDKFSQAIFKSIKEVLKSEFGEELPKAMEILTNTYVKTYVHKS